MKITKKHLQEIIKKETKRQIKEAHSDFYFVDDDDDDQLNSKNPLLSDSEKEANSKVRAYISDLAFKHTPYMEQYIDIEKERSPVEAFAIFLLKKSEKLNKILKKSSYTKKEALRMLADDIYGLVDAEGYPEEPASSLGLPEIIKRETKRQIKEQEDNHPSVDADDLKPAAIKLRDNLKKSIERHLEDALTNVEWLIEKSDDFDLDKGQITALKKKQDAIYRATTL